VDGRNKSGLTVEAMVHESNCDRSRRCSLLFGSYRGGSQRRWRNVLVSAMARQGFVNYSKEWWHFSLPGAGGQAYDFPITPRN
jgi:D-alanyl-D-alanine dipeptidase